MIGRKNKAEQADGQKPVAPARPPKKPKKRSGKGLGKLLAPAIQAAVGAMAFVFLFAAVVPAAWLNALAWQLYLDQLGPLLTPPLGMGARIGFAVTLALIAGLITFMIMLAMVKPPAEGRAVMTNRVAARARRLAEEDEAVPTLRAADAHPDAPARAPFRADRDMEPGEGDSAVRKAAWMDELASEQQGESIDEATLELDSAQHYVAPAPDFAPAAESADSLGALVARFEAGLARRRTATAAIAQMAPSQMTGAQMAPSQMAPATPPPASNDQDEDAFELGADHELGGDEPTVDLSLEAALSTLQRMTRRAVG
jgi:hypothetical protein